MGVGSTFAVVSEDYAKWTGEGVKGNHDCAQGSQVNSIDVTVHKSR